MFKLDTWFFFIDGIVITLYYRFLFSNVSQNDLPIILYELTIVIKIFQELSVIMWHVTILADCIIIIIFQVALRTKTISIARKKCFSFYVRGNYLHALQNVFSLLTLRQCHWISIKPQFNSHISYVLWSIISATFVRVHITHTVECYICAIL